jgi:hypothetical protein
MRHFNSPGYRKTDMNTEYIPYVWVLSIVDDKNRKQTETYKNWFWKLQLEKKYHLIQLPAAMMHERNKKIIATYQEKLYCYYLSYESSFDLMIL